MKFTAQLQKGFTLIELLVVIAVIGILAVVLLVAIDPLDKIRQGQDSGIKSSISQVSGALLAFGVNHSAGATTYPLEAGGGECGASTSWGACLQASGDLKTLPTNLNMNNNSPNYLTDGTNFTVAGILTSKAEIQKADASTEATCTGAAGQITWWAYRSSNGVTGYYCTANATTTPPL